MRKQASTNRKHDSSVGEEPDGSCTSNRTRKNDGSESSDEPDQCKYTSRTRSSHLSTDRVARVGQRRSARLSHIESQKQVLSVDKKKGGKGQKTREEEVNDVPRDECEKVSSKRTAGKSKQNLSSEMSTKSDCEGMEPAEKRIKRSGRSSVNKHAVRHVGNDEDQIENDGESNGISPKSCKKISARKRVNQESSETNIENQSAHVIKKNEKQEKGQKQTKQKKSNARPSFENDVNESMKQDPGNTPSKANNSKSAKNKHKAVNETIEEKSSSNKSEEACVDTIVPGEKEATDDSSVAKIAASGSAVTADSNSQHVKLKGQESGNSNDTEYKTKANKDFSSPKNTVLSPSKDDLVQEYNRSISEKISLLKPKTFAGRSSITYVKAVDDGSGQEIDSDAESRRAIMESAQRRIEQNLSTSESDSRLFRGMHTPVIQSSKNESSESESAPEAVSFSKSRQDALETIKSVAEYVKREKKLLKERRKARLEMLKQQKEEKLIRLKEQLASQEDASCSSSEESGYEEEIRKAQQKLKKKKKKSKTKAQCTEKENLDDTAGQIPPKPHSGDPSNNSSEDDFVSAKQAASVSSIARIQKEMYQTAGYIVKPKMENLMQDDALKIKKCKTGNAEELEKKDGGFKNLTTLDYIPLSSEGATKFVVVPLDKAMRAPKSLAEEAAEFRQNMLYGSRIKRESGKVITAYQQKLIASGKNVHVR